LNEVALGLVLGGLIGTFLGLTGAGGSILTVPALVYGVGLSVQDATGTALVVVASIAAFGALAHARAGRVHLPTGFGIGVFGAPSSAFGAWLNHHTKGEIILFLLAAVMLVAAARMLMGPPAPRMDAVAPWRQIMRSPRWWAETFAAGFTLGMLTGFLGVGGGFLAVPLLVLVLRLPTLQAVGTSLLIITIHATAGMITHLGLGDVDASAAIPFIGGGLAGALLGSRLYGAVRAQWHQKAFAALLAGVTIYVLVRNVGDVL
jgi:uncharacterized membrane protein YfcA